MTSEWGKGLQATQLTPQKNALHSDERRLLFEVLVLGLKHQTTVNLEHLTCYVGALVRGEEGDAIGDVLH